MTEQNKYLTYDASKILAADKDPKEAELGNSLTHGVKANPDTAGKINTLANDTGVPVDVVERNQTQVEEDNKYKSFDLKKILAETPETGEFLSDIETAKQSHDDVENLQGIEKSFLGRVGNLIKGMGSSVMRVEGGLRRSVFTTLDPAIDFIERRIPVTPFLFGKEYDFESTVGGFDKFVTATDSQNFGYEEGTNWEEVKSDPIANVIPFMIETGVVSIPDMIVAGLNPWLYGASMTGQVGQSRAENDLRDDATIEDLITSLPVAASMALLERFGAHGIMGVGDAAKALGDVPGAIVKGGVKEGSTEFVQEGLQSTGETLGTEKGFDLAETLDQSAAGFVGGGGFGAMASGTRATVQSVINRQVRSGTDALKVERILTGLEESKLNERNQNAIAAFLTKLGAKSDTESVYLDAEGTDLLFQTINDPEITESSLFQQIAEQIPNALESGSSIEIPIGDLAELVKTDLARQLQPHMVTTVDALTPSQMNDSNIQAEIKALQQMDGEQRQSEAEVYSDVVGQLTDLGWEQSAAEQYGLMYEAFFRTQAKRIGSDPMALYEEFGLKVSNQVDPALKQRVGQITQIDVLLDRLREGDVPKDADIFGKSTIQQIIAEGGLTDEGGEIAALDADEGKIGKNRLVRPNGRSLDDIAEVLQEGGFISERSEQAVIDAIDNELRGSPAYSSINENQELLDIQASLNELEQILGQADLDVQTMTNEEIRRVMSEQAGGDTLQQSEGENFSNDIYNQPAFHGTPHKFDKFSLAALGSDENFQAFGWGLYFAGDRNIAEFYKNFSSDNGNLFQVDIPEDNELLDHDKPLSEQSESVQKILLENDRAALEFDDNATGVVLYNDLEREFGSSKAASEYLNSIGIPGLRYLDDNSRTNVPPLPPYEAWAAAQGLEINDDSKKQHDDEIKRQEDFIKNQTHNYVIWDENVVTVEAVNDEKREAEELFQNEKNRTRGFFNKYSREITFTPNANLSTFLHESGHFFLEVMRDLSSQSAEIRTDLDQINAWFESQGADTEVKRHEAFASGFESYLMEGKAPTAELQSVFNRFRQWLTMIYKNLQQVFRSNNLEGLELTDEVRQVMNRMLASQEEIDKQELESYGSLPVEEMGLSEADALEYQKLVAAANEEAETELTVQLMRELSRERKKWWKEGVEEKSKAMAAEMSAQAAYQARDYLSGDVIPEGLESIKINRKYISERYGKAAASKLGRMSNNDGVHPDIVATLFGYLSGDEMVRDLLGTLNKPDRKKFIEAQAEQQMKDEHGDMMNDGTIAQEAEEVMHNDKQAEKLAKELKILNTKLDKNFAIKGTSKNVRPLYKAAADEMMSTTPVDAIKPHVHLRNEQKFGREALKFAAQGKWAEARTAKHKQLRQFYMYKAALASLKQADKYRARLNQIAKTKYSTKKVNPDYIQQVKVLVAAYDLRKSPKDSQALLYKVNRFVEAQRDTNPDLIASDILGTIVNWQAMTLNELHSLRDAAENLLTIGKQNSEVEREKFMSVVDDIVAHTDEFAGKTKALPLQNTPSKALRSFLRGFTASHRKFESILRQADGWEEFAPLQQNIMRPLIDATNKEIEMKAQAHDDLTVLFDGNENLFNAISQRNDTVEVGRIGKMTRGDRIVLALNWGNSGNRDALLNMQGYPLTEQQIDAAIATLSESDLDLVERIWEYVDTYYTDLAKTEQEATGIAPVKVEAETFEVNGRTMRGGYYPLQGDALVSAKQGEHDIEKRAERMLAGGGAARASSKHGAAIERKGWGGQPINLSINGLFQHIDGVIHDITHRKAVMQADRILQHPDVKEIMQQSVGLERTKEVRNKLVEIAAGHVHPSELTGFAKILRHTRLGLTYNVMGYSLRTALVNVTGIASSVPAVGKTRLAQASMEFLGSALTKSRFITESSVFMRNRSESVTRDINDIMRNMQGNGTLNKVRANAFIGITKVDALVSRITWLAAYNQAKETEVKEIDAVYYADRIVRRTQGSGLLIDQSSIESKNEFVKTFTVMYSYFNAQLNLLVEQNDKRKLGKISKAKFIENLFWIMLVPAVLEEWMMGNDDDDEKLVDDRWTKAVASYNLSYWAGIRETSGLVKYGMSSQTPLSSAITNVYDLAKQTEQGEIDKAWIRSALSAASTLSHIPGGVQLNRTIGYLMDLEENGGTVNPYGLLVTGKQ